MLFFCPFITDIFFKSLEPNEVFYNAKCPMAMLFLLAPFHPNITQFTECCVKSRGYTNWLFLNLPQMKRSISFNNEW